MTTYISLARTDSTEFAVSDSGKPFLSTYVAAQLLCIAERSVLDALAGVIKEIPLTSINKPVVVQVWSSYGSEYAELIDVPTFHSIARHFNADVAFDMNRVGSSAYIFQRAASRLSEV
jgi:hypothetical protein